VALRTYEQWKRGEEPEKPKTIEFLPCNDPSWFHPYLMVDINETVSNCRGCGKPLLPENYAICDGCECNYGAGLNHGLVPKDVCTCPECFGNNPLCGGTLLYSRYGKKLISLTEQDWSEIKGIGPKLAKKLVENGPYANVEEIGKVKGVGKAVLENIKLTLEKDKK
jgi:hypothetical protein